MRSLIHQITTVALTIILPCYAMAGAEARAYTQACILGATPCDLEDDLAPIVKNKGDVSSISSYGKSFPYPNQWSMTVHSEATFSPAKLSFKVGAFARTEVPEGSLGSAYEGPVYAVASLAVTDFMRIAVDPIDKGKNLVIFGMKPLISGDLDASGFPWGGMASVEWVERINGKEGKWEKSKDSQSLFSHTDTEIEGQWLVRAGVQFPAQISVTAVAQAWPRNSNYQGYLIPHNTSAEADYLHTFLWSGIQKVVDADTGEEISNWKLESDGGVAWDLASTVDEPSSGILLAVGLGGILSLLTNRRRFRFPDSKAASARLTL